MESVSSNPICCLCYRPTLFTSRLHEVFSVILRQERVVAPGSHPSLPAGNKGVSYRYASNLDSSLGLCVTLAALSTQELL